MRTRSFLNALTLAAGFFTVVVDSLPAGAGICALCGKNSATVGDGIVFDELSFIIDKGKPGGPKLKSATMEKTGLSVRLSVKGDRLFASAGGTTFEGENLTGLILVLAMKDGRAYAVKLTEFWNDRQQFWADPPGDVPTYVFRVKKIHQKNGGPPDGAPDDRPIEREFKETLCSGKYTEPHRGPHEGEEFTAITFAGDHYSPTHTVSKQSPGWFNLACFGTASAKMHLLRNTTAGSPQGSSPTTMNQRTAMLRAITADYCSDGRAWTGDGTPLWWTDQAQTFPLAVQPGRENLVPGDFPKQIEAVWGTRGKLLCLNEPRRSSGTAATKDCTHPRVSRGDVVGGTVACPNGTKVPRCDAFEWADRPDSPWSDKPLVRNAAHPKAILHDAQVITVNRPAARDYCEGQITWPPNPQ